MDNRVRQINEFKREIYGEYGFYYYVPMAEAYDVQIPVTISCSYNKCLYCDLNQGKKFRALSLSEIESNVKKLRYIHEGRNVKRFLLAGGNPFVLESEKLLRIADVIKSNFPGLEYISCFSRADDITRKTQSELQLLHDSGFDRLCIGIESGSDEVLTFQNKGVTSSENLLAMRMLDDAKIKYSCYIMLGLGGLDMSESHIAGTVNLLNQADPFELTVVTLVLFKGAKLVEKVRKHEFKRMSPFDALKEGRKILSQLDISTIWNATHKTNLFPVKGRIPLHREKLLNRIDDAINEFQSGNLKQYELRRWASWDTE